MTAEVTFAENVMVSPKFLAPADGWVMDVVVVLAVIVTVAVSASALKFVSPS